MNIKSFVRKLDVRTPSLKQTVGNLSGGNQQKVRVANWLAAEAKILI
jgi:ribose transport system ATP-binding protein